MLIGIDCAVAPKNVGLAMAVLGAGRARVASLEPRSHASTPAAQVAEWARVGLAAGHAVLLALDAPLGWPQALGDELAAHTAGQPLQTPDPNRLFRRRTDDFVWDMFKKRSLDVGADRIARTAYAALRLLGEVGEQLQLAKPIPLAWELPLTPGAHAIEVYPAATLKQIGAPSSAYKKPDQRPARETILDHLCGHLALPADVSLALDNANVLDALVCVLAAADFLANRAAGPDSEADRALARKEGWIWVRRRAQPTEEASA